MKYALVMTTPIANAAMSICFSSSGDGGRFILRIICRLLERNGE
jgi:hypothetical protein